MVENQMVEKEKRGFMNRYFRTSLVVKVLIGLVLGAIVGLIVGPKIAVIKPFGDLLMRLLQMVVVPIVFFSLIAGSSSLNPAKLGRVGIWIIAYYLLTTLFAVAIGVFLASILRPGWGLSLVGVSGIAAPVLQTPSLMDTLLNFIPTNIFGALASGTMLQVIIFAIVFGIALSFVKESKNERLKHAAESILTLCDGVNEVMILIVKGVLQYAPIGVFALIAIVFGTQGAKVVGPLGLVVLAVYLGLAIQVFVVYGGALAIYKLSLFKFLRMAKEAMVTAFVTRSSSATLPVTMRCADENMGIPKGIYSFTLPLGATCNLDGTAIYLGVCTLFVTLAVGMQLTIAQRVVVIITATLGSLGYASVPGAGAIMLFMVLNSIGLKVEAGSAIAAAYAMILGIDAILDMGRTSINITGDMAGTAIVAKREGELNLDKWK